VISIWHYDITFDSDPQIAGGEVGKKHAPRQTTGCGGAIPWWTEVKLLNAAAASTWSFQRVLKNAMLDFPSVFACSRVLNFAIGAHEAV
jgi:hypothetical protein